MDATFRPCYPDVTVESADPSTLANGPVADDLRHVAAKPLRVLTLADRLEPYTMFRERIGSHSMDDAA